MSVMVIISKTYGKHKVLLDYPDYKRIKSLGGKWCLSKKRGRYYVQKRIDGKIIEIHRYITDAPKGLYVDHINHNTLDNRKSNLRVCSNSANIRNGRVRKNNVSGVSGVSFEKSRNKWVARIKVNYRTIHLGRFKTFEDAIKSREEAVTRYWSV